VLLGLSRESSARIFYGIAAMETAVVSSTDWAQGGSGRDDAMYVTPRQDW
jgi:hypothetical protein